jgi:CheY-like chemotaxis protein/anti-sigma regulatory factor (Ser/Thr protein kinase)
MSLASKAKSDFLASMSHELRTPLNAIIGFSDLMEAESDGEQRTVPADWVRHIQSSGRHLLALVNDILDLAKIEAGRIDLRPEPLALPATVAEVVTGLRAVSDRKSLQVSTDVPALTVLADRIRLRQVLDNLLSNAIKFTPEGGQVRVSAEQTDTEVRLTVADTGVGIAAEDLKNVFDEFTQVGERAAREAGTGLGLTLTKRLVESHGGSIELQSEPGVGSRFTVCLPRRRDAAPAPDTANDHQDAGSGGVLIVEDDAAAAQLLTSYLIDAGYRARVVAGGEAGLRAAVAHRPDAIVLDILLPDADGWQVLGRLKSDPGTADIPVIVTTVLDAHDVGLALGAVDFLTKPVRPEALVALVTRHALLPEPPARAHVLAIDDDPATLELLTAALVKHGARTRSATTGSAGLELARTRRYDLIICDLLLPDIDGFAVIAALNADPGTRDVPIVVLTATDLTERDKQRLATGAVDVVRKGDAARERLVEWLARVT